MTRAIIAIIGLLALVGCAGEAPLPEQPTMYLSMADAGARLDPVAAASMISLYRQNNGLGGVTVDPELMKLAEAQSQAMASRLVLQVHDEVIVEVVDGEEDDVRRLTESALTGAADLRVPLTISMASGPSWAAAKG